MSAIVWPAWSRTLPGETAPWFLPCTHAPEERHPRSELPASDPEERQTNIGLELVDEKSEDVAA